MDDEIREVTAVTNTDSFTFPGRQSGVSYLIMIYGEFLGRRFQLDKEPIVIGRLPDCTIQLADDSVSRMHCRVMPTENGVTIIDLDSTNGTYVNGTTISARPLNDGDRIKVGRGIFKFLSGENIEHAYHEEIYRLKTTDGLTGAYNKRYFEEDLEREIHRYFRYGRPLSLLMMDIDHFKNINDDNGHLAGDRVLAQLAALISSSIRHEDIFCRYGGEEFALLMPEMELSEAIDIAEHLRKLIKDAHFEFDGVDLPITISIGVAMADNAMKSPEDFVKAADEQLYAAKRNGRDRVEPDPKAPSKS